MKYLSILLILITILFSVNVLADDAQDKPIVLAFNFEFGFGFGGGSGIPTESILITGTTTPIFLTGTTTILEYTH